MKEFLNFFPFRVLRIEQGSVLADGTSRMLIVAELQSFYSCWQHRSWNWAWLGKSWIRSVWRVRGCLHSTINTFLCAVSSPGRFVLEGLASRELKIKLAWFLWHEIQGRQPSKCNAKEEGWKKPFYNEQLCSVVPFFPPDCLCCSLKIN